MHLYLVAKGFKHLHRKIKKFVNSYHNLFLIKLETSNIFSKNLIYFDFLEKMRVSIVCLLVCLSVLGFISADQRSSPKVNFQNNF